MESRTPRKNAPTLVSRKDRQALAPKESWWIGLNRPDFAARALQEFEARMSLRVPDRSDGTPRV